MRRDGGIGGIGSMVNWGMLLIMIGTLLVWWSIFSNGFFTTLIWLVVIGCILGIIIKTKENTRV
tara:strand:- start:4840 stop:5031 length:192 start_codon:yes stop_codon:yes gene_type:complete